MMRWRSEPNFRPRAYFPTPCYEAPSDDPRSKGWEFELGHHRATCTRACTHLLPPWIPRPRLSALHLLALIAYSGIKLPPTAYVLCSSSVTGVTLDSAPHVGVYLSSRDFLPQACWDRRC